MLRRKRVPHRRNSQESLGGPGGLKYRERRERDEQKQRMLER